MGFIIIWRNSHRDPLPDIDSRGFLETYESFEEALSVAQKTEADENENSQSPWYFDFEIYELRDKRKIPNVPKNELEPLL